MDMSEFDENVLTLYIPKGYEVTELTKYLVCLMLENKTNKERLYVITHMLDYLVENNDFSDHNYLLAGYQKDIQTESVIIDSYLLGNDNDDVCSGWNTYPAYESLKTRLDED